MLQIIRNMVTGWLAVVIVVLLIIPFAFWGINYYFDQGGNVVAAKVNGTKISLRDYQRAYQRIRQQWQSRGADLSGREDLLKQQTIDTLVNRELLSQFKDEMNLRISDGQLRQTIMNISVFQGEDGFDNSLYNRFLASAGYTPASFEAEVREDMTSEQLQAGIIETSFVTDASVKHIARLNNQTRDIRYLMVPFDKVAEGIEVTDKQIKDWYDSHDREYMEPEKVRIAYIDLSRDRIAGDVSVTEQDLKAYYENNRSKYSVEEQRKIRQILIKLGQDPTQDEIDKASAEAGKMLERLRSGESFDQVAEEARKNAEVNMEVSEFGYLSKGILEDSVDEVAFSLEEGGVGGPIRTQSGIHVIEVDDIRGGTQSTFADVRDQVEADYRASQAEKQYFDYSERLATLAFEHPESLEVAAEDLDMPIQKSGFFSREGGDSDLLSDPKVISAAFSDEVLEKGNNSEVIELDTNHSVVLRVADHKLPAKKPLEEVRDDVVAAIRFEKGSARTQQIGEQIIKELKQGQASETVAESRDLEWQSAVGVKRDDPKVNRSVLRTAFSLGRPDDGPVIGGDALGAGDYAVVQVNAVHDAKSLAADDVRPVRKELERLHASEAFTQFLDTLKDRAEIRILRDNL